MDIFPFMKPYSTLPRTVKQVCNMVKKDHNGAVKLRDALLALSQQDAHIENENLKNNVALLSRAVHAYRHQLLGKPPIQGEVYAPIYQELNKRK